MVGEAAWTETSVPVKLSLSPGPRIRGHPQPIVKGYVSDWQPIERIGVYSAALESRKVNLRSFFHSIGFTGDNVQIFDAIIPDEAYRARLKVETKLLPDSKLTLGELGCKMSHMMMLQAFVKQHQYDYAVVFEDDVALNSTLMESLNSTLGDTIEEIARGQSTYNWQAINLGRCFDQCWNDQILGDATSQSDELKVVNSTRPSCSHAYMVSKQGAAMLLEWAEHTKNRMASDNAMMALSKNNENFTYFAITPRLFQQSVEATDSMHSNGATRECDVEKEVESIS
eukprot:CAMPEP_0197543164 /NCGR_PEP_ID=MMETSP1318-20131121/68094_1 /TAXON_ID=552666 /ORGANISM="Partenskyella glossopodia, Strain RCC365" /LENGTH=283 /DNA_ID=CAMNT_0043102481 /DNA_START=337 /DNA_END=1188 /DNA_ORIENTATION=+